MTLFDIFKKEILSPSGVIEKAIKLKIKHPNDTPEYIKQNFSILIEQLQLDAYEIYLAEEKRIGERAVERYIRSQLPAEATAEDAVRCVKSMFGELDRFFLSLTQSRRPRAGLAFEVILKTLFRKLKYPFDEQQVINGKPDFLMPGRKHYDQNPMDAIIFTAKRSLRERWRQIVTEGTRGLGFFLATIDETISEPQLKEIMHNRIYLVIPERIKHKNPVYEKTGNIISFEDFFIHHLDPAMKRWRANRIID